MKNVDSVDQRSDCTFCAAWSWFILPSKAPCVVNMKERFNNQLNQGIMVPLRCRNLTDSRKVQPSWNCVDCAGWSGLMIFADALSSPFHLAWFIYVYIVKPVLETTCIKQSTALKDHCYGTTPLLKPTKYHLYLETTCCKRSLLLLTLGGFWIQVILYITCDVHLFIT